LFFFFLPPTTGKRGPLFFPPVLPIRPKPFLSAFFLLSRGRCQMFSKSITRFFFFSSSVQPSCILSSFFSVGWRNFFFFSKRRFFSSFHTKVFFNFLRLPMRRFFPSPPSPSPPKMERLCPTPSEFQAFLSKTPRLSFPPPSFFPLDHPLLSGGHMRHPRWPLP